MRAMAIVIASIYIGGCGAHASPRERPQAPARESPAVMAAIERAISPFVDAIFMLDRQVYRDEALAAYVRAVGERVGSRALGRSSRFTFQVTDDPEVNAWGLPGGHVYVSRGALAVLGSEAELAFVLAHEMGHVTARHPIHNFWVNALDLRDNPADAIQAGESDQDRQYQADRLGLSYMTAAGYDPSAALTALQALFRADPDSEHDDSASRAPRLARLSRHIGRGAGGDVRADAWLDRIDGLVYGDDPRNGVLQGQRFTCARCGFALDIPAGYKPEMDGLRLVASRGQGEGTIALQRMPASATVPIRQEYLSQLQASAVTRQLVAGISVTIGTIPGEGQVDHVAVLAAGGDEYVLVVSGNAAESVLRGVLSTVRRVEASSGGAQPGRLRLCRAHTAGHFDKVVAQCCGPRHSPEALGRLNGMQPEDAVPAGRRLKCIAP
jgi:predicted Zn-dependent protease